MATIRHSVTALTVAVVIGLGAVACTDDTGSEEAFCTQVGEVPTMAVLLAGFADADPAELERRLDAGAADYAALRDAAPEEIRGRVEEVVGLVTDLIDAVRANPDDPEALSAEIRVAVAEHPEVEAASTEVEAYARTTCDVELTPTEAPTTGG